MASRAFWSRWDKPPVILNRSQAGQAKFLGAIDHGQLNENGNAIQRLVRTFPGAFGAVDNRAFWSAPGSTGIGFNVSDILPLEFWKICVGELENFRRAVFDEDRSFSFCLARPIDLKGSDETGAIRLQV